MATLDELDSPPRIRIATWVVALVAATSGTTAALATLAATSTTESMRTLALTDHPCAHVVATGGKAAISWTTSLASDVNHVMLGIDSQYGRVVPATPGTDHRVVVDMLTPGTTYHFRVSSTRSDTGATVQSGNCPFTLPGVDRTAPTVLSFTSASITPNNYRVTFSTNEPANAWVDIAGNRQNTTDAPFRMHHSIAIERLTDPEITPELHVTDRAGNTTTMPIALP
ncbi:fibronectin type III domain-containing protein [Candidatus Uhrbacteria bacterium]|nr:fibronectin type III domain-containing protein [Candidatus Uhrbacteria bacterium]